MSERRTKVLLSLAGSADLSKAKPSGGRHAKTEDLVVARNPNRLRNRPVIEKFLDSISENETTGCWEWRWILTPPKIKGVINYPRIQVAGVTVRANRFSYTIFNGQIPDGLYVLHKCDNPRCCNPSHLEVGTQLENMRQCKRRGRWFTKESRPQCDDCHNAILTNEQVSEILRLHSIGFRNCEITKKLGIKARGHVYTIVKGISWKRHPMRVVYGIPPKP